jgi:hypothetical protein
VTNEGNPQWDIPGKSKRNRDKGWSIKNLDRRLAGFDFVCGLCSDAEEEYIQIDQYVKHALVLSFVGLFAPNGQSTCYTIAARR